MEIYHKVVLLVLFSDILLISCIPLPSSEKNSDDYGDDYGDFTEEDNVNKNNESKDPKDPLKIVAGAFNGLLGILEAKIKFIRSILKNRELHEGIGRSLETGVNIVQGILSTKIGAAKAVADVVPDVLEGAQSGTRFVDSVLRAAYNS